MSKRIVPQLPRWAWRKGHKHYKPLLQFVKKLEIRFNPIGEYDLGKMTHFLKMLGDERYIWKQTCEVVEDCNADINTIKTKKPEISVTYYDDQKFHYDFTRVNLNQMLQHFRIRRLHYEGQILMEVSGYDNIDDDLDTIEEELKAVEEDKKKEKKKKEPK
eukprot:TRINITY_DN11524_c0_g1_i2.p1 TRINITY_DN11524_c0_g1~~TRINITY_DN11524_c0_g1_i2.p1  ORF type:complete len:171 (+),score=29.76 TRINITY_DN11524_c0_g1_i2:36-515(+)